MFNRGKQTFKRDGINWVWFLDVDWQGAGRGEITILRHYRIHKGDKMPETTANYELIEDDARTACAVAINGWAVAVKNRKHVFEYDE